MSATTTSKQFYALLFGQAEDPTQAFQLFQRIPTDQMHEVISYREVALVQSPQ